MGLGWGFSVIASWFSLSLFFFRWIDPLISHPHSMLLSFPVSNSGKRKKFFNASIFYRVHKGKGGGMYVGRKKSFLWGQRPKGDVMNGEMIHLLRRRVLATTHLAFLPHMQQIMSSPPRIFSLDFPPLSHSMRENALLEREREKKEDMAAPSSHLLCSLLH